MEKFKFSSEIVMNNVNPDILKSPSVTFVKSFVKNAWFVPSPYEFFTFLMLISLFIILVTFFHYSGVQRYVKKNSRCLMERQKNSMSGIYTVTANNRENKPLYKVSYDLTGKEYTVECACKEGKYTNQFNSINVYDLKRQLSDTIDKKLCQCSESLNTDRVYYSGYPGLVRFMNTGDTSFFNPIFAEV